MTDSNPAHPRNLLEGWCTRGESLAGALRKRDPAVWMEITESFRGKPEPEPRAALLLYAITGLRPTSEDLQVPGQGRDGAVDISLSQGDGQVQIVEVSSSVDPGYQSSTSSVAKFEDAVARNYEGEMSWMLNLERGWEANRLVRDLAPLVASALNRISDVELADERPLVIHEHVRAWPLPQTVPPVVWVQSRNAGALNLDGPYLDALTDYLATDPTIRSKLEKLQREAVTYQATRTHLYLGMASTGVRGALLPSSPSYFTWGSFEAPGSLTDIWLEGGGGEIYHWTIEGGWIFHKLDGD